MQVGTTLSTFVRTNYGIVAKKKSVKIPIDYSRLENVYTDLIELSVKNDAVTLVLATRDQDKNTAMGSHRVYMTLSQFMRFANICTDTADAVNNQIEKATKPKKIKNKK